MPDYQAHITYDAPGTPGIWARDVAEGYFGLGYVHGLHRPLQTLVLTTAGAGLLSSTVWPTQELIRLDTLALKLDLPGRAAEAVSRLSAMDGERLAAFVQGIRQGLAKGRPQYLLRALGVHFSAPSMQDVLSGLLLSSYLGLAESQDRMERAVVACLQHGADTDFLERLHAPHLVGWDPELLRRVKAPLGNVIRAPKRQGGGSNAWAVSGARSASGYPILCGDPHLPINQLPAILLPVRVRLPHGYWLGASIPGLPGLAVGRNASVAFSGTFSCADNSDSLVDELTVPARPTGTRVVMHKRRGQAPHKIVIACNDFGLYDDPLHEGPQLCTAWCSGADVAQAIGAYMQLPMATSVADAGRILENAHTLSLHYILADRSGAISQQQAGIVPRRAPGWSGFYPLQANGDLNAWRGTYRDISMPRTAPVDDMVVSANEAGIANDGAVLASLAQPHYRRTRIRAMLGQTGAHDVTSMAKIQQDVVSLQAKRLLPFFVVALPAGPIRQALISWDMGYEANSFGAHAFSLCYNAALGALAPLLGGRVWQTLLAKTEISVWWCQALDALLARADTWRVGGPLSLPLRAAFKDIASIPPEPWGRVQRVSAPHMLFGQGPIIGRPARPLVGSVATVSQGNLVPTGAGHIAVAPAFRMICDLGEDALYCALPGGIDDRPLHPSYASWLCDYDAGHYYRLTPPAAEESQCMP